MNTVDRPVHLHILVMDDDDDVRRTLGDHLRSQGHQARRAASGEEGLRILAREPVDVVITDVRMPGMDGFEVLRRVRESWPDTEVIVVTAFGDVEGAVRAIREGAFDYFTKPFSVHDITASLTRTARFQSLRRDNVRIRERLERLQEQGRIEHGLAAIIGESAAIQRVREQVTQVAATPETTVLISGDTGTGKELVARAIHFESARAGGPFVPVDCTAIPESMAEDELYGHVKGAFTDAREAHRGLFERADGGTLFLDEIGDMSQGLQASLLRTLEERRVRRLGSEVEIHVDVRLVSATNRDLEAQVADGAFRQDLLYRLNTFHIHLPSLVERREDIPALARAFMSRYAGQMRKPVRDFTPEAMERLSTQTFPGNVRELKNAIERAVILCSGEQIGADNLSEYAVGPALGPGTEGGPPPPTFPAGESAAAASQYPGGLNLATAEKALVLGALAQSGGNRSAAAELLGISRDALRRRLVRYEIEP